LAVLPSPVLHSPGPQPSVPHPADGGYYRYRGRRKPDAAAVQAEQLRQLLKEDRRRISFNASSIRALSVRLNQHVAQALCDGLKMTGLARAAGLSLISGVKSELAELEESKAALEGRRLKLLAAARRLGTMDDYELAALSGLPSEAIRKMTWGLAPDPGLIPA
jgi:hypothetical protein